jgi:hypothetical protein
LDGSIAFAGDKKNGFEARIDQIDGPLALSKREFRSMCRLSISVAASAILAFGLLFLSHQVAALERLNVVVIGLDLGRDSVSPRGPVFKVVFDELTGRLNRAGFAIFDQTAFALDRVQLSDEAELLSVARAVKRPPLDIAVLFSFNARSDSYSYSKKLTSRLTARLLDLRTGRRLGSFQVEGLRALRLPLSCAQACLRSHLTDSGRQQAGNLAGQLIERLSVLDGGHAAAAVADNKTRALVAGYGLVFEGFTDREVSEMEEYLVVFKGYQLHRPVATGGLHHEFWYETTSPRVRLNRNLIKMLQHLRLPGHVGFAEEAFTLARAQGGSAETEDWDSW